ncbi:hypothetical protein NDU88_002841 [Pleurodeles waltl]|uniref:Uncharacterized protein n=1 Tax=Pleurodeles waltl TaxID=8319 RepID=A0AAV7M3M1_PLEWA|nr:hypothetical protein NDU88_002841 [Pleurodeles waltl]
MFLSFLTVPTVNPVHRRCTLLPLSVLGPGFSCQAVGDKPVSGPARLPRSCRFKRLTPTSASPPSPSCPLCCVEMTCPPPGAPAGVLTTSQEDQGLESMPGHTGPGILGDGHRSSLLEDNGGTMAGSGGFGGVSPGDVTSIRAIRMREEKHTHAVRQCPAALMSRQERARP